MFRKWGNRNRRKYQDIEPDEILIDAQNLPGYDARRLEGKIQEPIEASAFRGFVVCAFLIGIVFVGQLIKLQIVDTAALSARAEANRLEEHTIIADRGLITDRNGVPLAINTPTDMGFSTRTYPLGAAAAHLIGYVSYPKRDSQGNWFKSDITGVAGVEQSLDTRLAGANGSEIKEVTATGDLASGSVIRAPREGETVQLSIDAGLEQELYDAIKATTDATSFTGGSGVIMDVTTGEVIALTSYPSFDPEVVASGTPSTLIRSYLTDPRAPFLDRAIAGLYTPGSVVKPFVAAAALEKGVITPEKQILSTGSISVPNPYNPSLPSIFKDWKAHGWVDMRHAIAVSSDVYFYEIGGGFTAAGEPYQPGLGISAIDDYLKRFGIATATGIPLAGEEGGTIPTPAWKAAQFNGERWFLGDTYHTAIGQYGFQTTPLQLARATAALANGGTLLTPTIERGRVGLGTSIGVSDQSLKVAREGMRLAVAPGGTAVALDVPGIEVAGKTGTAQVGVRNEYTNSVVIGFFPYAHPRYAFALVMERAKAGTSGAPATMATVLQWIVAHRPEMAQ